jgi:hypothetical protein
MKEGSSPLGRAALELAQSGYSVIPIAEGKKSPPLIKWEEYQKRPASQTEVYEWWQENPNANVGIVTGEVSDLTVIDIDPKHGGRDTYDKHLKGVLPPTRVHRTPSGGRHYLFRYNEALRQSQNKHNHPGIDIRNDGGYIVAPPSVVDGIAYGIINAWDIVPLTTIPDVFNQLVAPHAIVPASERWISEALENGAPESMRNETAAKLIGYFHSRNITRDIIETTLMPYAQRCVPPMDLEELRRTIDSVTRYERAVKGLREPPKHERQGEEDVFTFESAKVTFRLFDVKKTYKGFEALVQITTTRPPYDHNVWGPRSWVLNSTSGTRDLIKVLEKAIPDLDWGSIVDTTARIMVEMHRKGEPSIVMSEVPEQELGDLYDLPPYIVSKHINMLIGDGETGKSIIADAICLSFATMFPIIKAEPKIWHRCLYLDWETDAATHKMRMLSILRQQKLETSFLDDISYMRMELPLQEDMARVKAEISRQGIGFVVVDSVAMAVGADLDNQTARDFSRCLRALDVTVLAIAHVPKTEVGKVSHGPMGGVTFRNMSRNGWTIVKHQEEERDTIDIALHHTKHNNDRKNATRGLSINFYDNEIGFEDFDLEESESLAETLPTKQRVMRYVRTNGWQTKEMLGQMLGIEQRHLDKVFDNDRGRYFMRSSDNPPRFGLKHTG